MSDPTNNPVVVADVPAHTENSEHPEKQESRSGLATIATLLALAALILSGLTWYQIQVKQVQSQSSLALGVTEIGGQIGRIGDSVKRLQSQQDKVVSEDLLANRLAVLNTEVSASLNSLAAEQAETRKSLEKLNVDLQTGVGEYLLKEVEQLLKLANHNLVFAGDKSAALAALQMADGQLRHLGDPRFSGVRAKINQEITELNKIEQADVAALSAELGALSDSIPSLPLMNEPAGTAVAVKAEAPAVNKTFRSELNALWQDLRGLIKVQRVEQAPIPLLAPEQRYFLNQNLQLQINRAQIALLQGRQAPYESALGDATEWLQIYFDLSNDRVQASLQQLESARAQKIEVKLPSMTGAYSALQQAKGGQ